MPDELKGILKINFVKYVPSGDRYKDVKRQFEVLQEHGVKVAVIFPVGMWGGTDLGRYDTTMRAYNYAIQMEKMIKYTPKGMKALVFVTPTEELRDDFNQHIRAMPLSSMYMDAYVPRRQLRQHRTGPVPVARDPTAEEKTKVDSDLRNWMSKDVKSKIRDLQLKSVKLNQPSGPYNTS